MASCTTGLERDVNLAPRQRRGCRTKRLIAFDKQRVGHHAHLDLVEVCRFGHRFLRGHTDLALWEHGQQLQPLLSIKLGEHLVDRLRGAEKFTERLGVLRQQVGDEKDLRLGDERAGETRALIDELQDAGLRLFHRIGGFTERAIGEELHLVVGIGLDLFLEFLGKDALHVLKRLLKGVSPCIGGRGGRAEGQNTGGGERRECAFDEWGHNFLPAVNLPFEPVSN